VLNKLRNFLACEQSWLALFAFISIFTHNIFDSYQNTQFTLFTNLLLGALVWSGFITSKSYQKEQDNSTQKDTDETHTE
jgi:hypothetical protein